MAKTNKERLQKLIDELQQKLDDGDWDILTVSVHRLTQEEDDKPAFFAEVEMQKQ